jgi:hypothetical protein
MRRIAARVKENQVACVVRTVLATRVDRTIDQRVVQQPYN